MTLLTKTEIEERIALYQRYAEALERYAALDAVLPHDGPGDLLVTWEHGYTHGSNVQKRVSAVVKRAWGALRAATLRDMLVELEAAEAAVRAFESGEVIDDDNRTDGAVGGTVASASERQD